MIDEQPEGSEIEIDTYHGDAEIDYVAMKKEGKVKRIYMKVSEYSVDPSFVRRCKAAQAAGFPVGGYHFLRCNLDGKAQGQMFVGAIAKAGLKMDLPSCCDYEDASPMGMPKEHQFQVVRDWYSIVEASFGVKGEMYTGESFARETGFPPDFKQWKVWIAHYQTVFSHVHIPGPWTPEDVAGWQFTDAYTVAGLPPGRHVDASYTFKAQV